MVRVLRLFSICILAALLSSSVEVHAQFTQKNLVRLKITGGTGADETVVYVDENATDEYDTGLDAVKMLGGEAGLPNIYTLIDTGMYGINALGPFFEDKELPLGILITRNGNYKIQVLEIVNRTPTTIIYLEDRREGLFHNLDNVKELTYALTTGFLQDRFYLHFTHPVEVETISESCLKNDGFIKVNNPSSRPWDVTLASGDGLTIYGTVQNLTGEHIFAGMSGGEYALRLSRLQDAVEELLPATVERNQSIDPSFTLSASEIRAQDTIVFSPSGYLPNLTYSWDFGDGTIVQSGASVKHHYNYPGVYTITLVVSNGVCTEASQQTIIVSAAEDETGISNTAEDRHLEVFPSPASDIIWIKLSTNFSPDWIEIRDIQGRLHKRLYVSGIFSAENFGIPVAEFSNGVYFVSLLKEQKALRRKFVVSRQ